jgi:DNA-binding Lrp family transcriptional regulator
MKAYVLIKIRTGEIEEAIRQMHSVPGVVEANATFGPYDGVAVVEAQDVKTIGRVVVQEIQPIVGVLETLTCLVIDL